MDGMDDFATGLVDEVLSDMAENFFGSRKRLDELIERFGELARELNRQQAHVAACAARLAQVLPERGGLAGLLRAVGVEADELVPKAYSDDGAAGETAQEEPAPRALTRKGRYAKLVQQRYHAYQRSADTYMNGRCISHPENSKRCILSLHYQQLGRFAQRINETIEKMNQEMPVSCIIRYAKGFADPVQADRERITGALCPVPDADGETSLDKEFAYHPVDTESYGLFPFPELPPLDEVKAEVRRHCAQVYEGDKAFVLEVLESLRGR